AAENIFLGREPRAVIPGFIDFRKLYGDSQRLMDGLGVRVDVRQEVSHLSVAQQQMVEIAKATSRNSSIIAMDEPSATLTDHELQNLFELIRTLRGQGVGIIYISHRMEEIFSICDRVTVLRDGHFAGKRVRPRSPRDAIAIGIGLVPEDRKSLGLVLNMVVRENTTLANLDLLSLLGFVNRKKEREVSEQYVHDLRIRTPGVEQEV